MFIGDIVGTIIVYLYVASLLIVFESAPDEYSFFSRKMLHIMVGNIVFILPLFETRWAMVLLAALPFIFFTYLMSPKSPIDLENKVSLSGHGLGLVYYSISWTVLATLFFQRPEIIAVGIIAMSYGDGFASLLGKKFGKHKFPLPIDKKTVEGSLAMLFVIALIIPLVLFYFSAIPSNLLIVPIIILSATTIEIFSMKGLDNLLVPILTSIIYYILI